MFRAGVWAADVNVGVERVAGCIQPWGLMRPKEKDRDGQGERRGEAGGEKLEGWGEEEGGKER